MLIKTGSYYVITNFNLIWDIGQLYPVYSDDIIVITLDLGSASVSRNNHDIILVPGYNYNIYICISYNTGKSALPDIYSRCPRASAYISGKARVPVL